LTRRAQIVDQTVKRQHASVTLLPSPHAAGAPVARVAAAHAVFLIRQHDAAAAAAAGGGLASPLRRAAPSVVRAGAEEMLCEGDLLFLLKDRHGYVLRRSAAAPPSVGTPAEAPAARVDAPVEAPVAHEEPQAEAQAQPQVAAEAEAAAEEEEPVHKRRKASAPKRRGKAAAAEG
jgi:hypothetical protein